MSLSGILSGQSTTETQNNLSSVILTVLLKAKKFTFHKDEVKPNAPGRRISMEEVKPLPLRRHRHLAGKHSRHHSQKINENIEIEETASPKIIDEASMPIVHDRLPDPDLWKKLQFEEDEQDQEEFDMDSDITELHDDTLDISAPSRPIRSVSTHGVVRFKQLYCRTGFHLQILPNGEVAGTRQDHNPYAILEFKSVGIGIVSIRGLKSGLYLTMDDKGQLYGSERLSPDYGYFSETILENYYNTYSTIRQRNHSVKRSCYVALGKSGHKRAGCRSKKAQKFTHFLPRDVLKHKVPRLYTGVDF